MQGGMNKITIFDQYLALSRKWCKIEPYILWKATRNQHPSFRMAPVWMILSDLEPRFQSHDIIQRQITQKRYQKSYIYNSRPIESRIWSIERRVFNDLEQPLTKFSRWRYSLTLNISQSYGHSYYGRQIGNRTKSFEWYRYQFEWPSVTFSRSRLFHVK